ncbi:MAG: YajQ family cyclic di-GMP-binding protein [Acidobacteria bacterium]|nr:YajQ family cyclic di-GMP-binding protein [Acidobacteriota bacterium]
MAAQVSFDITSEVDLAEVDNAVNQAKKEITQRYDFKGSKATIDFKQAENKLELVADDNMKMNAMWEILLGRLVRRGVPAKNLTLSDIETVGGGMVKRIVELQQGVPPEAAKDIVKFLKDKKLRKVQASIQGDQLRVTSSSKDELQESMALLRGQDFGCELRFGNYRG